MKIEMDGLTRGSPAHAAAKKLSAIADAANRVLEDREVCKTPAEAALALALHDYGNGYEIKGSDQCACDEPCEECATTDKILVTLRRLAA